MIQKEKKTQVILDNATHEGDTGSRRSLLDYLAKKDINRYRAIIAKLGIRK